MKKKIGEILVARSVISAEDIGEALAFQADGNPNRLGEILVQQGRLESEALARALAEQKSLPYTELDLVSSSFMHAVPLSFQHYHALVPFEEPSPGEFCIAVADPLATDAIERARKWLKAKSIQLYVASSDEIGRVLSAMEDKELAAGEILASAGEGQAVSTAVLARAEDVSTAFHDVSASLEDASASPEDASISFADVSASLEDASASPEDASVSFADVSASLEDVSASPEDAAVSFSDVSAALETEGPPQTSTLSEEDLFGSLKFEEEQSAPPLSSAFPQQPRVVAAETRTAADELTQIVRRPGPPPSQEDTVLIAASAVTSSSAAVPSSSEREITPVSRPSFSTRALPGLSPLGVQLMELLLGRETEALAGIVVGLADLLVSKSILSSEEVLEMFVSPLDETW